MKYRSIQGETGPAFQGTACTELEILHVLAVDSVRSPDLPIEFHVPYPLFDAIILEYLASELHSIWVRGVEDIDLSINETKRHQLDYAMVYVEFCVK